MEYREFRGVEGLVVAKILVDTTEAFETDTPRPFAGVRNIEKTKETASETKYYDNLPAIVLSSEGPDEIKLVCSVTDLEQDAYLEGKTYDEATGAFIDGETEQANYAIGYITKDTKGNSRYVWRYKGTLTKGAEVHITEDNGTESNGVEWTYTGIKTTHKFTKGGNCKGIVVDESKNLADLTGFFEKVTTPDDLKAKA